MGPGKLTREEAIDILQKYVGQDLFPLAEQYEITTWDKTTGKQNKGWFGQVVQCILGLPLDTRQAPDFEDWELKTTSLKIVKGRIVPKETIAVTMINKGDVLEYGFYESHLYKKLRKEVIVARIVSKKFENSGRVHCVAGFDLTDEKLFEDIEQDYEFVRATLRKNGTLTGKMGKYVQPRTKGSKGSTTRAFYMRKSLVKRVLGL